MEEEKRGKGGKERAARGRKERATAAAAAFEAALLLLEVGKAAAGPPYDGGGEEREIDTTPKVVEGLAAFIPALKYNEGRKVFFGALHLLRQSQGRCSQFGQFNTCGR